jgi:hypothetical protein
MTNSQSRPPPPDLQPNIDPKQITNMLVGSLLNTKLTNPKHRLPTRLYKNIVTSYKGIIPNLTVSVLKNKVSRLYKKHPFYKVYHQNPPPPDDTITAPKKKPGRPVGTTLISYRDIDNDIAAAKDEITQLYLEELRKTKEDGSLVKKTKKGIYDKIVKNVITSKDLPESFCFPYNSAMQRIYRNSVSVPPGKKGPASPLEEIEEDIVELVILLGETGCPLTPPNVIRLINSMIKGTPIQSKLIQFKRKTSPDNIPEHKLGTVGTTYYKGLMERNRIRLRSKRGRRFELNRAKWETYTNFLTMYEDIEAEMVDAGLATKLQYPIWMNEKGEVVRDENEAYGCKVHTQLTRPDMCIVLDEVGCNTSQIKDGHVGGRKYVVGKNNEARVLGSKRDKHFTCLGLTLLNGEPLMCVIIIDSKQHNVLVETGIDLESREKKNRSDEDELEYFLNNLGENKQYPGGPSCTYQGTEIPCMVKFSEGGGMTPSILTEIFETLDQLKIFDSDRKNGLRPFVLMDGHQSRFDYGFLSYMNHDDHRWSVCIGVPYGTAKWQVGDSRQQNGMFKVRMCQRKEFLLDKRESMFMTVEIAPTDIIPLVRYGWDGSFANVQSNKVAILERGWYPLNRNLLLDPLLRNTMTDKEKEDEQKEDTVPLQFRHASSSSLTTNNITNNNNASNTTVEVAVLPTTAVTSPSVNTNTSNTGHSVATLTDHTNNNEAPQTLNFGCGLAASVLDRLVSKSDLQASRQRNIESKRHGEDVLENRLKKMSRKSAAQLVTIGQTHVLGKPLTQRIKEDIAAIRVQEDAVKIKKELAYRKYCIDADAVLVKNEKKDYAAWSNADLQAVIKPVKLPDDGAMPSRKAPLLELWEKCQTRVRVPYDTSLVELEQPIEIVPRNDTEMPSPSVPIVLEVSQPTTNTTDCKLAL